MVQAIDPEHQHMRGLGDQHLLSDKLTNQWSGHVTTHTELVSIMN